MAQATYNTLQFLNNRFTRRALGVVAVLMTLPAWAATLAVGEAQLLRYAGEAASVFVADPAIADVQVPADGTVLVMGKKSGQTTLFVLDDGGKSLMQQSVAVRHNTAELGQVLRQRFPALKLMLESAPGSLMISGNVPDAATIDAVVRTAQSYLGPDESLINRLAINSPTQVYLRVRVTEVSKAVTQQLGINWSAITTPGNFFAGVISGRTFQNLTGAFVEGAGRAAFSGASAYSGADGGGYSFLGGYANSGRSVQAMIDVLDREGLISVLAEPNLTAVSGETASFLAGGEFPIPVKQSDSDSLTVEFKPFGVALDFTPTVLSDDRISIKVRPEISEIDPNNSIVLDGLVIPGLSVRRVETTVEMASGQSFAIGGLLQNNIRDISSQIPGLGQIPILGRLFSSSDYRNNKTELVVIVTPYLVKPTDSSQMASPLESMRPSTDIEYILYDKIGLDPIDGKVPRLTGSAGFVY
ncbi:type II and III secretion system protein family protein [Pusillimonas minor]|uniref:Type II and III secretion system protein family protein n=1 Tax=Pusillimonas minor TaxID=2697024 RepID=A0A842HKJ5_9BURK|nr:type II and III secretion system protein family protein [Pusillimonas minor]MBC2768464.1 type II and III secretion system protein family protein [Pusillimonas minor]